MKKLVCVAMLIALCLLLCSCGGMAYHYSDSRHYTAGAADIDKRVEKLDIGWLDGTVTVEYHNGSDIELSETGAGRSEKDQLHWYLEGRTLHVRYAASGQALVGVKNKGLTVKLPRGLELDEVKIAVTSAEVAADGVDAEKIHIQSASGRVALRQYGSADEIKLDTASGNVAIACENTDRLTVNSASGQVIVDAIHADDVNVHTASGAMTLQFADVPERVNCDSVSGNVTVLWPEKEGFTADVDTISGSVGGGLRLDKTDRDDYRYLNGGCRIDVNTVSGNVYFEQSNASGQGV